MFIINELQKSKDGKVAIVTPVKKETENQAWQEYYSKLSYAAASSVYAHTVKLEDDEGNMLEKRTFFHES